MSQRSDCPISNVLDIVGDKWSLLILRDMMFFKKRSFSELQHSNEKVATNILSNRLEKLENDQLISKQTDPSDRRKKVYALTAKGKAMLPILLEMIAWSSQYAPDTRIPHQLVERMQRDRASLLADLYQQMQD